MLDITTKKKYNDVVINKVTTKEVKNYYTI